MTDGKGKTNGTMTATDWEPLQKEGSTLKGHFAVHLSSGLTICGMSLHEKGKGRWAGTPVQSFKRKDGSPGFKRIVAFRDPGIEENFNRQALAALDQLLADLGSEKGKPKEEQDLNF